MEDDFKFFSGLTEKESEALKKEYLALRKGIDMDSKFDAWEEEARVLIEKEIDDPVIKEAIWFHHGRSAWREDELDEEPADYYLERHSFDLPPHLSQKKKVNVKEVFLIVVTLVVAMVAATFL